MHIALDVIAPPRFGRDFRWLLATSVVNNTGDGIVLAAGPLLVASQTHDPFLVSLAITFDYLPWLLFGLVGGVAADRFNRRLLVIGANIVRAVVLVLLAATIVTGSVSIAYVLAAILALGTAEVFADSASSTLMPSIVPRDDLAVGNARMQGTYITLNQLVGPPIGAFLFAIGMAVPFATNAVAFLLGAVLISRISSSVGAIATDPSERRSFVADLLEGLRWLAHHAAMRTLAITIFTFNVTWGAAMGVLVLYSAQHLHLDAVGFGLLTTSAAAGGILATAFYVRLTQRFSLGNIMRVGLVMETLTHLVLAATTSPLVAFGIMFLSGAHGFTWGATANTVRQRAVPNELLGRVGGVMRFAGFGGLVIGTPLGGLIAGQFGITGPFWFAFVGSAILVVLLWRQFAHIAHDEP
ncbi:MAG: MFS transporter [Chloroflexota bacterium]|nr:MFS transporter [Chloroflexota bacterium]